MRKPKPAQVKLRLPEELQQRLQQQASHHSRTLNAEVRLRLEDSLEPNPHRPLEEIIMDMRINWAKYAGRFLSLDLADKLADHVLKGGDAARIRLLAQLIVEHRAAEERGLGGVS